MYRYASIGDPIHGKELPQGISVLDIDLQTGKKREICGARLRQLFAVARDDCF
jgi:hypothetical protein